MQPISIRQVNSHDLPILRQIARDTFFESFAESNTEADMAKYLEENFSEQQLNTEIINPNSLFYLALDNSKTVGYLKVNFAEAQTDLQEPDSLEIERIYVKASYHGKQVGKILYHKAVEIAKTMNKTSIWLGVWEKNPRAIRFYEKNGFIPFDTHIFKMGQDEQTDILMRKVLNS